MNKVHIILEGDDFKFEADISMVGAGQIISSIGEEQERRVRLATYAKVENKSKK